MSVRVFTTHKPVWTEAISLYHLKRPSYKDWWLVLGLSTLHPGRECNSSCLCSTAQLPPPKRLVELAKNVETSSGHEQQKYSKNNAWQHGYFHISMESVTAMKPPSLKCQWENISGVRTLSKPLLIYRKISKKRSQTSTTKWCAVLRPHHQEIWKEPQSAWSMASGHHLFFVHDRLPIKTSTRLNRWNLHGNATTNISFSFPT